MKILMVAAENDALPGGKVGGIGDVVRDVPPALAAAGHQVDVVTPGYSAFSKLNGAKHQCTLWVTFAGGAESVDLYVVPAKVPHPGVTLWALEHPLFAAGGVGKIYCDDPSNRPFATDASKFALFSAAVAQAVMEGRFGNLDVLHLHDWHAASVAVLRAFDPRYQPLQSIHTVYTIHNLALQGVRPLSGDESSLNAWFHGLGYDVEQLNDPRAPHCFNPMRAGINLCDRVQAVSPTYAREILQPSDLERGYFGGESLEGDLQRAAAEGRLHGILNGCEYPEHGAEPLPLAQLLVQCEEALVKWIASKPVVESTHLVAIRRLARAERPKKAGQAPFVVTSVGRLTDQKVLLLQQVVAEGQTAIDQLLHVLGDNGVLIMLGSGNAELEHFLTQVAARNANFIFLKGYAETLSEDLYAGGDLFLMPSSFEPCGISQMLAMRAGQPCLVHRVGGLADTVEDGKNGFSFSGDSLENQARNMISCFEKALEVSRKKPKSWQKISAAAAEARFLWQDVAAEYTRLLYQR